MWRMHSALRGGRWLRLMWLASAFCGAPLCAHDLWMVPTTFSPQPGQIVGARLRVGQNLAGDPLPLIPALVNQFIVEDGTGRRPVVGRSGADPAGVLRAAMPGLLVIGYHSHPSTVELPADVFNAYLVEEGLDAIALLRARRDETGATARERFARCAKSLVYAGAAIEAGEAGEATQAVGDRRLGFPLELVAENNPYAPSAGQDFPVRLTYEERPLGGALVIAMNTQNPSVKQALRTDDDGRVRFHLHAGGMWLIKAVHMVPAPAGADAEWASFWASLTFEWRGTNAQLIHPLADSLEH